MGLSTPPTPLWNRQHSSHSSSHSPFNEQVLAVTIDNSSVFVPGGSSPQYGFRRTDIIAQKAGDSSNLILAMETGVSVFHFSIKADEKRPLNYSHEYQVVYIEPHDGTHVFEIQLGEHIRSDYDHVLMGWVSLHRLSLHEPYGYTASPGRPRFQGSRSCFECLILNSVHIWVVA